MREGVSEGVREEGGGRRERELLCSTAQYQTGI